MAPSSRITSPFIYEFSTMFEPIWHNRLAFKAVWVQPVHPSDSVPFLANLLALE